ncbi:POTRA domain, ShlB-type [compost metagenome]
MEAAPPSPVEEGRCFEIRRIDLEGAEHLNASVRQQLLEPYADRCLGVAQLNELLKVITDYYLDRGFVTSRAYLPQQDLSDGQLDVIVVEGKLEGLDSSSIASERELAMAFPGETGHPSGRAARAGKQGSFTRAGGLAC